MDDNSQEINKARITVEYRLRRLEILQRLQETGTVADTELLKAKWKYDLAYAELCRLKYET